MGEERMGSCDRCGKHLNGFFDSICQECESIKTEREEDREREEEREEQAALDLERAREQSREDLAAAAAYIADAKNNPGDYDCPSCLFRTLKKGASRCPKCHADPGRQYWVDIETKERDARLRAAAAAEAARLRAIAAAEEWERGRPAREAAVNKAQFKKLVSCVLIFIFGFIIFTLSLNYYRREAARKEAEKQKLKVTVTLQNNGCTSQDFYLSGQLITTIPAESSQSFSVTAGRYEAKACTPHTSNCGSVASVDWRPGTVAHTLYRHPNCRNVVKPQFNSNGTNYGNPDTDKSPRAGQAAPPTTIRSTPPVAHEQSPPALSSFTVTIRSTPSGATVYLDRNRVGITPFTTTLGKGIYGIKIEKEGYQRKIGQIEDGRQDFYVELLPE